MLHALVSAQSTNIVLLEKQINGLYQQNLNRAAVYYIEQFLKTENISNDDAYQANLLLSKTHISLRNYDLALASVNKSLVCARKSDRKSEYISNASYTKAMVLFEAGQYTQFRKIQEEFEESKFKYLSKEQHSRIIIQQAYLFYLEKNYRLAKEKYDLSLNFIEKNNPCLLFELHLKMMELFGALNNREQFNLSYYSCKAIADTCNVLSNRIKISETMVKSLANLARYHQASNYFSNYINEIRNRQRGSAYPILLQQEDKYKKELEKQQLGLQQQNVLANQHVVKFRIVFTLLMALCVWMVVIGNKYYRLKIQKRKDDLFMREMLEHGEIENKRLALEMDTELVKGINAVLKQFERSPLDSREKLKKLAESAKKISVDLRPHLFEYYGLHESIHHLVTNLQENTKSQLSTDIKYFRCLSPNEELQLYRTIEEAIALLQTHTETINGSLVIKQGIEDLLVELMVNGMVLSVATNLQQAELVLIRRMDGRIKLINGLIKWGVKEKNTYMQIKIPRYN
ncbi:MAG: hypothetical protein IT236_10580 [Bacteroidia bacterium]|nr:hypothetical protein [Bacteroidia bacterium]